MYEDQKSPPRSNAQKSGNDQPLISDCMSCSESNGPYVSFVLLLVLASTQTPSGDVVGALSAVIDVETISSLVLMVLRREDAKRLRGSCCRASTLKANEVNQSSVL